MRPRMKAVPTASNMAVVEHLFQTVAPAVVGMFRTECLYCWLAHFVKVYGGRYWSLFSFLYNKYKLLQLRKLLFREA